MASKVIWRGPEDQAARSAISRLFEDTRKRLVETGTRNRLVHVNRANTRGNVLNIVGPDLLEGAAKLGSMESILTLCEARGLPSRMLNWHYRSRDPSLIEVLNREFYDNGLILPPSPLQEDPAYGLCFTRVDGVYDMGGKRDNRKEGGTIVARVAEHGRQPVGGRGPPHP